MNGPRALLAGLALMACAPAPGSADRLVDPILDGTPDAAHTGVVFIFRDDPPDGCTGFLIAPDLVATARHCVAPSTPLMRCDEASPSRTQGPWPARVFFVTASAAMVDRARATAVSEVLTPVGPGAPECGNDLALLRLERPFVGPQLYEPRLDQAPEVDEPVTVSGYGFALGSNADAGPETGPGTRRMRSGARVLSVGAADLGAGLRASARDWVVDVGPCRGDSGSPAFDAAGRVFGVLSRGYRSTCAPMIYNRLDAHSAWLRAEAARSYARHASAVPAWALRAGDGGVVDGGVTPPSGEYVCSARPWGAARHGGALALAVAASCLARRRRR